MSGLSVQARISLRVLAFLVISAATAADFAEPADKAQAAYAAAQRKWQIGLAELVIEQRPEFERSRDSHLNRSEGPQNPRGIVSAVTFGLGECSRPYAHLRRT